MVTMPKPKPGDRELARPPARCGDCGNLLHFPPGLGSKPFCIGYRCYNPMVASATMTTNRR